MKKIYYGLWQDFYLLSWSIRFAVEIMIIWIILLFIIHILKVIFRKFKLKEFGIKLIVLTGTFVLSFLGRENQWAHNMDEKLISWGNRKIEFPLTKNQNKLQVLIGIFMCMIYLLGILPETPLINYLDDEFKNKIYIIQQKAQKLETAASEGYKSYEPILTWNEKNQDKIKQIVQIRLNKKSEKIYKEPSAKSKAIAKINKNDKIEYQNNYKKANKKIWLKIYLPKQKLEGWLKGEAVEKTQINELIKKSIG